MQSNWGASGTRGEATWTSYLNHIATIWASYYQAQLDPNPFGIFLPKETQKYMCFLHFIRFDSLVQGRRYSSGVGPWSEPKRTSRAHLGRKPHPALAIILHLMLKASFIYWIYLKWTTWWMLCDSWNLILMKIDIYGIFSYIFQYIYMYIYLCMYNLILIIWNECLEETCWKLADCSMPEKLNHAMRRFGVNNAWCW